MAMQEDPRSTRARAQALFPAISKLYSDLASVSDDDEPDGDREAPSNLETFEDAIRRVLADALIKHDDTDSDHFAIAAMAHSPQLDLRRLGSDHIALSAAYESIKVLGELISASGINVPVPDPSRSEMVAWYDALRPRLDCSSPELDETLRCMFELRDSSVRQQPLRREFHAPEELRLWARAMRVLGRLLLKTPAAECS